jgi:membrane-bound lytic murein transglycosylase D
MKIYNALLLLLLTISLCTLGCSRMQGDEAAEIDRFAEADQVYRSAREQQISRHFHARFDSVVALYEFGDFGEFMTALDSLRADLRLNAAGEGPDGRDEQIAGLLCELDKLDSLAISIAYKHRYLNEEDSLALSALQWPEENHIAEQTVTNSIHDPLFPTLDNKRIQFWIQYFTGPGKDRFERTLARMQLHRKTVDDILIELGMPKPLICVALIESGFVMEARSYAKAVGPWQFIPGTGRMYGLRVNWWMDERRDIVASTYAAANYLRDLHGIWNSWFLALAAYNCGEYRVARAVAKHETENFWNLQLPKQTERYVPKFLAALYIVRNPEKYGITLPDIEPLEFDIVTVKDATDLKLIADLADTDLQVVKELNSALLRYCTPPKTEMDVKVPKGKGALCAQRLADIPPEKRITWRQHRIRPGETLSQISTAYGTSITALKSLNGIKNSHKIRAGTTLIVPSQGGYVELASSKPAYKDTRRSINKDALEKYAKRAGAPGNHKKVIYTVKKHDTLGEIAEAYKTSARKLRLWNNLYYRSYIFPGQKLVIYVPSSFSAPSQHTAAPPLPSKDLYKQTTYTVKKGDTLYRIARTYDVSVGDLLAWNKKKSRSTIYPGEKLQIYSKK